MEQRANDLARLVELIRDTRGECPPSQALVAFRQGTLPEDSAASLRAHIDLCGLCQVALHRLESAETTMAPDADVPGWTQSKNGLRDRMVRQRPRRSWQNFAMRPWQPALAWCMVLALVYPAYLGVRSWNQKPSQTNAVAVPRAGVGRLLILQESALRGEGAPAESQVALSSADGYLTLQFFIPIRTQPEIRYSAQVSKLGEPAVLAAGIAPSDEIGTFLLVIPRQLLSSGKYELIVSEYDPRSGQTTQSYRFTFTCRL